ncbi:MAG: Zn-dependent hydrolase [Pseudomonadota bacterium]
MRPATRHRGVRADMPPPDRALLSRYIAAVMEGVNAFGIDPSGGWSRVGFSDADMAARRWLCAHMTSLGFTAHMDGVGNVIGRWGEPEVPTVMVGSHTDTVARGGAFDGLFGVAAAVAAVAALRTAGLQPRLAVEVVSFADEEGRFGGMLGSQTLSGQVTRAWIDQARDADGIPLVDAMAAHGLCAHDALGLARAPGSVAAYLEAHVEQGPVLEGAGVDVGIAPSITGVCVTRTRMTGQADHSGTTPMDRRHDALAAAAKAIAAIPGVLKAIGAPDARATVGKLDVTPNTPHTIPGVAEFTAVLRDADAEVIRALEQAFAAAARAAAEANGVACQMDRISWLDPVQLDPTLAENAAAAAKAEGVSHLTVPSGAGHDAQSMQALCPSALLFAPSRGGISHAPEEHTDHDAMVTLTAVLYRMITDLVA